jgi:hypothetical protein
MARLMAWTAYGILAIGSATCATAQDKGESKVTFQYGFRYDPMKFVEQSDTLEAALVRRDALGKPKLASTPASMRSSPSKTRTAASTDHITRAPT